MKKISHAVIIAVNVAWVALLLMRLHPPAPPSHNAARAMPFLESTPAAPDISGLLEQAINLCTSEDLLTEPVSVTDLSTQVLQPVHRFTDDFYRMVVTQSLFTQIVSGTVGFVIPIYRLGSPEISMYVGNSEDEGWYVQECQSTDFTTAVGQMNPSERLVDDILGHTWLISSQTTVTDTWTVVIEDQGGVTSLADYQPVVATLVAYNFEEIIAPTPTPTPVEEESSLDETSESDYLWADRFGNGPLGVLLWAVAAGLVGGTLLVIGRFRIRRRN